VRAITQLGRELGMTIVAEGVETKEQYDALAEVGVDAIQGFFLARPMDGKALAEWLKEKQ
jgi:EAL domain-containing protein (putative c-di-GMP-specific phosphodiesterase class I)